MKQIILSLTIALLLSTVASAYTGTITGRITDEDTQEGIIGANIVLVNTRLGTATDMNGYFQIINIPPGEYILMATVIGYESARKTIIVMQDGEEVCNLSLKGSIMAAPEVVISAERLIEGASVSDIAFSEQRIKSKDGLLEDPTKIIASMPGVASQGDLFAGSQLYIRGGAPEENLFLLDWAQVHWPWYFGGLKSVFNSQIVENMELLTGGFPPKYGDALSSVLSVTTRDGRKDRIGGGVSLGTLSAQGLIEGPITDRSTFLFTTRRTYLDLFMGDDAEFPVPEFYDFNLKLRYNLTPKHSLHFAGFASREGTEFFSDNPDPGLPGTLDLSNYVNTQSLVLKSILNENMYSKLALTRGMTDAEVIGGTVYNLHSISAITILREDLTWQVHPKHQLKAGFELDHHDLDMVSSMPLDQTAVSSYDSTGVPMGYFDIDKQYNTGGAYIQDSYSVIDPLILTGGVRFDNHFWTDESTVSPRLSMRYEVNKNTALRAAWGDYRMFTEAMFLDSNPNMTADQATHYIFGISQDFSRSLSGWAEVYYKDYRNLVLVDTLGNYSDDGSGYAKGLEFFLQKQMGALSGWISLSLSESKRQEFLDTKEYDFDYDQPLMSSLVLEYAIPKSHGLIPELIGMNFRYASGRPYTPTVSANYDQNNWIPVSGETNSERYDDFHNLTFRSEWRFGVFNRAKGKFYLEVWNMYNRENVMGIDYSYGNQYPNNVKEEPYYSTPLMVAGGIGVEF